MPHGDYLIPLNDLHANVLSYNSISFINYDINIDLNINTDSNLGYLILYNINEVQNICSGNQNNLDVLSFDIRSEESFKHFNYNFIFPSLSDNYHEFDSFDVSSFSGPATISFMVERICGDLVNSYFSHPHPINFPKSEDHSKSTEFLDDSIVVAASADSMTSFAFIIHKTWKMLSCIMINNIGLGKRTNEVCQGSDVIQMVSASCQIYENGLFISQGAHTSDSALKKYDYLEMPVFDFSLSTASKNYFVVGNYAYKCVKKGNPAISLFEQSSTFGPLSYCIANNCGDYTSNFQQELTNLNIFDKGPIKVSMLYNSAENQVICSINIKTNLMIDIMDQMDTLHKAYEKPNSSMFFCSFSQGILNDDGDWVYSDKDLIEFSSNFISFLPTQGSKWESGVVDLLSRSGKFKISIGLRVRNMEGISMDEHLNNFVFRNLVEIIPKNKKSSEDEMSNSEKKEEEQRRKRELERKRNSKRVSGDNSNIGMLIFVIIMFIFICFTAFWSIFIRKPKNDDDDDDDGDSSDYNNSIYPLSKDQLDIRSISNISSDDSVVNIDDYVIVQYEDAANANLSKKRQRKNSRKKKHEESLKTSSQPTTPKHLTSPLLDSSSVFSDNNNSELPVNNQNTLRTSNSPNPLSNNRPASIAINKSTNSSVYCSQVQAWSSLESLESCANQDEFNFQNGIGCCPSVIREGNDGEEDEDDGRRLSVVSPLITIRRQPPWHGSTSHLSFMNDNNDVIQEQKEQNGDVPNDNII